MKIKNVPASFKAGPDDGLAEGELVVSKAGTFLRDGDKVKPQVVAGAGATGVKG